jgi:ATP-dependent Zn protease
VSSLITHAHGRAREILEGKRLVLDRVAKLLLDQEIIEGDELRRMLGEEAGPS